MFDIGFWELCIIGTVLLLVLGPERMPEVARQASYWLRRARRTINDLRTEMRRELDSLPSEDLKQVGRIAQDGVQEIKNEMTELQGDLRTSAVDTARTVHETAEPADGDSPGDDRKERP